MSITKYSSASNDSNSESVVVLPYCLGRLIVKYLDLSASKSIVRVYHRTRQAAMVSINSPSQINSGTREIIRWHSQGNLCLQGNDNIIYAVMGISPCENIERRLLSKGTL